MFDLFAELVPEPKPLSVSQVTSQIKNLLERRFTFLVISGEISNCRPASSGHLYFTLKDSNATLSAVMFRGQQGALKFKPRDGQQVIVSGNISLYEPRGSYQIICQKMELAGEGELLAILEERKKRLASEGLFDSDKKRSIPLFPKSIGVITSSTGAALRDILSVVSRRQGGISLQIYPVAVQGDEAASMIVHRIIQANFWKRSQVLILARGGGSIEDLLPFSDESVVRAVANSEIPIISAVGHEIDWALSDFACDLRAPTPSVAAELATAESQELLKQVVTLRENFTIIMEGQLYASSNRLRGLSKSEMQRIILHKVQNFSLKVDFLKETLESQYKQILHMNQSKLSLLKQSLEENSPLTYQKRGLARIIKKGEIIGSVAQLQKEEQVQIQFIDGLAIANINEVKND